MSLIDINKMKTNKMKTNKMKTIFRTLLILGLILIVSTSFLSDNRANNFMNFEVETEESLDVEDWMTNENTFNVNSMYLEVETEESLEVEDWMTNENTFNVSFVEEIEEPLEVENWMINDKNFQ
jgi:hypothetical protein